MPWSQSREDARAAKSRPKKIEKGLWWDAVSLVTLFVLIFGAQLGTPRECDFIIPVLWALGFCIRYEISQTPRLRNEQSRR